MENFEQQEDFIHKANASDEAATATVLRHNDEHSFVWHCRCLPAKYFRIDSREK